MYVYIYIHIHIYLYYNVDIVNHGQSPVSSLIIWNHHHYNMVAIEKYVNNI